MACKGAIFFAATWRLHVVSWICVCLIIVRRVMSRGCSQQKLLVAFTLDNLLASQMMEGLFVRIVWCRGCRECLLHSWDIILVFAEKGVDNSALSGPVIPLEVLYGVLGSWRNGWRWWRRLRWQITSISLGELSSRGLTSCNIYVWRRLALSSFECIRGKFLFLPIWFNWIKDFFNPSLVYNADFCRVEGRALLEKLIIFISPGCHTCRILTSF